jgi:nucleotide-binding universal stress UspA family protein
MSDKLNHILIAVDDGPSSEPAVQQGLELAAAVDAHVTFVHVASILGQEFTGHETKTTRVPDRGQFPPLRTALAMADEEGVDAEAELLVGYAPEQIAAFAEELDADMIVVGSRHFTGARRMLHGSTSRALLDATRRPLMVVTEPALEPARA